ncbi:putative molybdenum cofactor biosynthesis protein A [Mycobacterium xenopi 3993]|nr:putative molybdenum cofactor biosynthesis protein A [Mycobacterium xenopi 3993]
MSLDTVDRARFAAIARRDRLPDVLAGLAAAKDAGLEPIKVNAVLDPVTGREDVVDLLRFCLEHGYQLRVIEQMPLDAGTSGDGVPRSAPTTCSRRCDRTSGCGPTRRPRVGPCRAMAGRGRGWTRRKGRGDRLGVTRLLLGV